MTTKKTMHTMHEAQLYWDDQDPQNAGWYLRYRDADGTEQGTAIEADQDATTEELAAAVESESHWLPSAGTIRVYRHEEPRGRITIEDGAVTGWRS
jgi:hypothetical protein